METGKMKAASPIDLAFLPTVKGLTDTEAGLWFLAHLRVTSIAFKNQSLLGGAVDTVTRMFQNSLVTPGCWKPCDSRKLQAWVTSSDGPLLRLKTRKSKFSG